MFIEAQRVRYPRDVAPGFWDHLLIGADSGEIFSIEAVYEELTAVTDPLSEWVKEHRERLFRENSDEATQLAIPLVGAAIDKRMPAYTDPAKQEFLRGADPWLIAYCRAHGHVLVTEEVDNPLQINKVRIPAICRALEVKTMNMLQMLRAQQVRLVSG